MRTIAGMIFVSSLLMVVAMSQPALCQDTFPDKPITIIVPWPAGSAPDLTTRAIQAQSRKTLAQPIVIVNKPGSVGATGFVAGANAKPDGYTVTFLSVSNMTVQHTTPESGIDVKKIDPVIRAVGLPLLLMVRQDSPWKSFKEFIEYAKSNPGKIRVSNNGFGGVYHLCMVGVEGSTGVKFTHLPFKSATAGTMALLGGHVEAAQATVSHGNQMAKSGQTRALLVFSPERHVDFPDVPTAAEAGIDFDLSQWYGYGVPKGTPKENIKIIHDAFKKAMESPEFGEFAKNSGMVVNYLGLGNFGKYMEQQSSMWLKLVQQGGVKTSK